MFISLAKDIYVIMANIVFRYRLNANINVVYLYIYIYRESEIF